MKKLNFGIIGGGMIGEVHIKSLLNDGRVNVSWLTTRKRKTLNELSKKYDIRNISTNYIDMLKDPEVDAVIVATPPFTHLEIGKEVIKANKNLIMEKPLVISKRELNSFVNLAKTKPNLLIMECSARHARLQPKYPYIKNQHQYHVYLENHNEQYHNSYPLILEFLINLLKLFYSQFHKPLKK